MIASLRGSIEQAGEPQEDGPVRTVSFLVGGVGYQVVMPLADMKRLMTLAVTSAQLKVLVQTIVREDSFTLYGFASEESRALFRQLVKLEGVGPSVALKLIGTGGHEVLEATLLAGQVEALTSIKGVGRKTAEKLIEAWS